MIKIKANEELFNEIKDVTYELHTYLPTIIQNDMEISEDEFEEYVEKYNEMMDELELVTEKILNYIQP